MHTYASSPTLRAPTGPGALELEQAWALEGRPGAARTLVRLYRRAAELGQVDAMVNLGAMLRHGDGCRAAPAEAERWYRRAWNSGRDGMAAFNLGLFFDPQSREHVRPNRLAAMKWYRRAIEQGEARALTSLAWLVSLGRRPSAARASVALYLEADRVDAITAGALYNLGISFEFGVGASRALARAMKFYRRAAELGDADAQVALGYNLWNGIGCRRDQRRARHWYERAAQQGHAVAKRNLMRARSRRQGAS